MARYDWPREFTTSTDRLEEREEFAAAAADLGTPPGLLGDLDTLNDLIQANFEAARLWVPLGPSILINGQAAGSPMVSGRSRSVRVSPNGQRAYVASANGGVWYSPDAGTNWFAVGAWGLAAATERSGLSLTMGELLVHFGATGGNDDPDRDVVYAATGEARPGISQYPSAKSGGIGVLRLHGTIGNALAQGTNPWQREGRNLSGAGIFRLAHDPAAALSFDPAGANTIVAATSNGLWARTGAFAEDADWQRVDVTPSAFDANDGPYCSDVVWNDKGLWVTVANSAGEDGLWRSTNGIDGLFAQITLPNLAQGGRISLGPAPHATDRMYILGKTPPAVVDSRGLAHLWLVDLTHSQAAAREVANFPVGLFTSKVTLNGINFVIEKDQADYDQAIAVTQGALGRDVLFVGGSLKWSGGDWNASLFRLTMSGTAAADDLSTDFAAANQTDAAADPTFIGAGIHPDVHGITLNGTDSWVCCDGGVFRRSAAGNVRALNAGLATAQPGYVASHPILDGPMISGTHDNGAIQRIGDTVWKLRAKGDGGGCMFHPTKPHQVVLQYINSNWRFLPVFMPTGPAVRHTGAAVTQTETTENSSASFYSQGAVARTTSADQARIFVGTDRIWHSPNWGDPATEMDWVTIPTGTDPYDPDDTLNDITQDALTEGGSRDKVIAIDILHEGDPANGFDGMAILVLAQRTVRIFRFTAAPGTWTPIVSSIVSAPSGAGAASGKTKKRAVTPNPFLDHLPRKPNSAWTDIAVHRINNTGHESFYIATTGAVTVKDDGNLEGDADFDVLWWYDGNGRWYPTGLRNAPADGTAGTGGSPAAAHSVVVDPDDPNTVYVGNRIGVWKGRINQSGTHPSWTWRPAMEGLPQTLVEDLHIFKSPDGAYLRAALVSRGVWERDLSLLPVSVGRIFIRSLPYDTGRSELPAVPRDPETDVPLNYHSSPDLVLLTQGPRPWDPGRPNEAELFQAPLPATFFRATYDAWIMVHHRHTTPVAGSAVDINLFLQRGAPAGAISGMAINAAWRTAVLAKVSGQAAALPAGLSHLGLFHPPQSVDARTPQAVKVPVDLSFAIEGAGPDDYVALIAVITSLEHPLATTDLAPNDLETIVRRSAQVAVRKVRRL